MVYKFKVCCGEELCGCFDEIDAGVIVVALFRLSGIDEFESCFIFIK